MTALLAGFSAALAIGLTIALLVIAGASKRLRKQTERAVKAEAEAIRSARLAEVGALTGVLAHEIKNPLSTVGLNLQLLQEDLATTDGAGERLRNRLDTVQRETTRLRDILDDFLRYAGKLELDRKPADLNRILEELGDFFDPQAQLQRVQLRLRLHPSPVMAEVDSKAIKQAVLNLMINAVQAMSAQGNGGELILSVMPQADARAVIDVIDTGPGIPADALDKVFQAYYSTKSGGTGLGLAMARRIAEEHGGELTVRSDVGKGTDFSLSLPLVSEK
jgi:signal transduction histidine kinase